MQTRSIPGCNRGAITAEFVADAASDHADIRTGMGGYRGDRRCESRRREHGVIALSEDVVVFNAGGPIRCKAVLKTNADHAAPTGPLCLSETAQRIEDVESLVCHRRAALDIKQGIVPSVTNLAREET